MGPADAGGPPLTPRRIPFTRLTSRHLEELPAAGLAIITRRGKPVGYLLDRRRVEVLIASYELARAMDKSVPERLKLDLPALRDKIAAA